MSDHYFSSSPTADDRRRTVTATVWDRELTFDTAGGVFATSGLDKATAVLLRSVDPPTDASTVLDLGCGWGPIAVALAAQAPRARVVAVDVNERALELTRENAARNGVTVEVYPPAAVPPDLLFDEIWSNPPIRIGKPALHAMLEQWLGRLAPGGRAHLVVGKNLGADTLQRWLTDQGWPTDRVTSAKGFRVLTARARGR